MLVLYVAEQSGSKRITATPLGATTQSTVASTPHTSPAPPPVQSSNVSIFAVLRAG